MSRIIKPDEEGTTAVCLVGSCEGAVRRITRTEHYDQARQHASFGKVLALPTVPVYYLECGHAVTYFTGV